ncbi:MAG: Ig-like domain-containing protein [Rikenellaceae bacterium]|nr:Ig-like domain-containing protein [Rikenellaceae bacterium]
MVIENTDQSAHKACWGYRFSVILVMVVFSSGLFSRCANIGVSPEGGPKDTIPPRVVRMSPPFNSTHLWPGRIVIDFDEYIQLKDQQEQFFTSPFMEVKPTLSYKNKSAIVTIDSPLDSATTYVLNLGSSVVDNNEGNPLHGLKYTFSTGDYIDSMFMSGFVSDAFSGDTVRGAYIFFFEAGLDSIPETDSLLFDPWKALAVAKTLSDGGFIFSNLKPIDYRVYALMDHNKNQIYDPGTDEVAFLDTVYNPAHMPSFLMWYDSTYMHAVAEPQIFFNTFKEELKRNQNLTGSERIAAQQFWLKFAAPEPNIRSFDLPQIDPEKILVEYPTPQRDSILYWLDILPEELPDTLVAEIVYDRPDSAGVLYEHELKLQLIWIKPVVEQEDAKTKAKEERLERRKERNKRPFFWFLCPKKWKQKEPESEETELTPEELAEQEALSDILGEEALAADSLTADSIPKSLMKFSFTGGSPVIPGEMPILNFELPVSQLETSRIVLYKRDEPEVQQTSSSGRRGRPSTITQAVDPEALEEREVPVELMRDSMLIRQYRIQADWTDGGTYRLVIPAEAIRTIDGELNDTINQSFTVARNAEMGSITLNLTHAVEGYEYIVQIFDEQGSTLLKELAHLTEGVHTIDYIPPGKVTIRMIEDRNGNGVWDTVILTRRIQPETVRWYNAPGGFSAIDLLPNTEFEVDVDLTEIFKPRTYKPTVFARNEEHEHDHDHPWEEDEPREPGAIVEVEEGLPEAFLLPMEGRSDIRTSEARVEGFEILDPKAEKKAAKAAKRAAKAERKAARRAVKKEIEDERHPGDELNYMKDVVPLD